MYSRRKKTHERHNIWRSYSDMMAGLLLLFLLVMCISFMQAQKNYQEKLDEEAAHELTQSQLLAELEEQESLVASQQSTLDEQSTLLSNQQQELDEQAALASQRQQELNEQAALVSQQQQELDEQTALIAQQQQELDEQTALIAQQQQELNEQAALITQQQQELDEQATLAAQQQARLEQQEAMMLQQQEALGKQEALMTQQQQKIEQIIGIKADLITDLKREFDRHSLSVTIDETDGSIALDANILFGYNENVLTDEGDTMLNQVLPVYCKVLMSKKYQEYLAEVRIDGYTDTSGNYLYNLQLSQERALAVASYLIAGSDSFLTVREQEALQTKLTANGHSMSNPVYSEDGQINMDASRRVEIKFTLKDEEMIHELKQILDEAM